MKGKPIKKNLLGKRFGYLQVVDVLGKRKASWLCKCDCGKERIFYTSDLLNIHNYSCGCMDGKAMLQHGLWKTRFYRIWDGMRRRCTNPLSNNYHRYGGRGIKLLWKTCLDFKNDMYKEYLEHVALYGEANTTIDRINNDGNYCKDNCRWATLDEQNSNRSNNVRISYKSRNITVTQLSKELSLPRNKLYNILRTRTEEQLMEMIKSGAVYKTSKGKKLELV